SQSSISLQDNISDRQISPIITQHEQPNREIVNEDNRGTNFNYARVQYIHSLCELTRISYELTKKVKELKKDNKFSVSRFIEDKDQETGETVKAQVYKIIKEEALGIIKEEARIRDEIIAAQRFFMLVDDLIKNIKEKYSVDTDYKLIEKSLKEVEDNF
ncbi:14645_t:CDS:2, partial [Cetraspora pellucida]